MFYSTDISVTVWIFNKNKHSRVADKGGVEFKYRDRTDEVLFLDLRQKGHPYEKKYIELTQEDRKSIVKTFHDWQSEDRYSDYENVKEYSYAAKKDEIVNKDYSLVTSKYIEFDHDIEELDYAAKMSRIQGELGDLFLQELESRKALASVMEELGYGIKL